MGARDSRKVEPPMTAAQARAARGLLGWSQSVAASRAGVSRFTLGNLERGIVETAPETWDRLASAFRSAGVTLLGRDGVRLVEGKRKPRH
jgi:DNA-binding XRE family transcriptional regulator